MRWGSCLGMWSAGFLRAVFDALISDLILSSVVLLSAGVSEVPSAHDTVTRLRRSLLSCGVTCIARVVGPHRRRLCRACSVSLGGRAGATTARESACGTRAVARKDSTLPSACTCKICSREQRS